MDHRRILVVEEIVAANVSGAFLFLMLMLSFLEAPLLRCELFFCLAVSVAMGHTSFDSYVYFI